MKGWMGSALAALATGLATSAGAQEAASPADAGAAATGLGEIVVTAQRRQESAQSVPIAITVIDGETLSRRGVTDLNRLQYQVPSLEIVPAFGGGQPQFRLRGVGFEDYATNNTPTVGVTVDDVAYPVPATTQGVLFDIARVEVLRGPQGTLYGRNTTGGAVNVVTNRPTDRLSAGGTLEYGRFGLLDAQGFVSGPLTDTLKVRIAATTQQDGGWQRNRATGQQLGDQDKLYGRGLLEWTPTSDVDVLLNVHGGRDRSDALGLYLFSDFQTKGYGGTPGAVIPADTSRRDTGWGYSAGFASLTGTDADAKPHRDNASWGTDLTINAGLGDGLKLTSVSSYEHLRRREYDDWDASASHESDTYWGSRVAVASQELRLASTDDGLVTWVAGAYWSHQRIGERFVTDFTDSLNFLTDTHYRQTANSISGFGQVDVKLTDKVTATLGARYEHEHRALRGFATDILNPVTLVGSPTFSDGNRDQRLNTWSGKAELDYHLTPAVLLYASASRGVKSGGFTAYNSPSAGQINAFRPETLYAYEVGFKSGVARNVRLNGAAFYYDYRNQQVLGIVVDPAVGAIGRITNAPRSRIAGGELELEAAPIAGLTITQALGYKDGEYRRYDDVDTASVHVDPATGLYTADTISLRGKKLPFANWSYQGSASYTQAVGGGLALTLQGNYSYRDTMPSFLGPVFSVKRFWLADATVTLAPADGPWSVGLYGRNIFDAHYDLTRNYFLPNARIAAPGRPATYGIRLGYRF